MTPDGRMYIHVRGFSSVARLLAPRMEAYNLTSVRTYVRTYVRPSVDSDFSEVYGINWFETLGQEQVRSEDYARQIDF